MDTGTLLNQAGAKAKEALGLTDTSVDAKLLLNGIAYEVETFNIQFQTSYDYKGEPQREVKGGLISIGINHVVDKQINNWMFSQSVKFSGKIVFASFSRIAEPVIIVEFSDGRCIEYTKTMGHSSVSYNILISAQEVKINGIKHENNPEWT